MEPITPKNEGTGLGEHNLTPHAHLHLSHTRPLQERLQEINKLFATHPVLSAKTARINSLAADRPIENKEHVAHLANLLMNHEKLLWQNVKLNTKSLKAHSPNKTDFTDAHKKHISEHQSAVNALVRNEFTSLCEFALISNEKKYPNAHLDYQKFMAVAGAAQQLSAMQELLEQQHLMFRKLDARLNLDAHRVAPLIEDIRLSLADQQVIASRLPEFKLK